MREKVNEFLKLQMPVAVIIDRLQEGLAYVIKEHSNLAKKGVITEKEKEMIIGMVSSYATAFVGVLYHDHFREACDEETEALFQYFIVDKAFARAEK